MNNVITFLNNITKDVSEDVLNTNFEKNFKNFNFVMDQHFMLSVSNYELQNFLHNFPEALLNMSNRKDAFMFFLSEAEENKDGKEFSFTPITGEDEVGVSLKFDNKNKLLSIIFFNDRITLTLGNKQNAVVYERKSKDGNHLKTIKLEENAKEYNLFSKKNDEQEFGYEQTYIKKDLEKEIVAHEHLFG